MARDLIPPPSPAGRPAPDQNEPPPLAPQQAEAAPSQPPAGKPGPSAFRARFGFATGVLAGCALAAAALLVVLLSGDEPRPAAPAADEGLASNWSPWHPRSTTSISGAQEIAKKIGGSYKDGRSKDLSTVEGGPIALNKTLPVSVAIPSAGGRFVIVQGVGVQYKLAGFGKGGRLRGSRPSAERRRLLRREALELSLYSFRYLPDVTMVVTLLPPAPKAEQVHPKKAGAKAAEKKASEEFQRQALFFRPGDLRKQIERPLAETLATKAPKIDALTGPEAKRIDKLTLSNLFTYEHIQQQDGSIYLVLDRPS
jgi:hypothetical protein